jgi:hypothetical protein
MAINLVSLIMDCLTPDMIGRIGSALGLDRTRVQSAVNSAVPSMLAGFSNVAAQPGGAQRLADAAMDQTGTLEGFSRMLGTPNQSSLIESGSQMLSSLLGNRDQNALTAAIGRFTGIGQGASGSLLGMLAPVVMGMITRQLGAGVDPKGITNLLAGQKDNIAAALPAGLANQLTGTGLLDSIGGAARTAAAATSDTLRSSASMARSVVSDSARRAAGTSPSANWLYWLIPVAAAVALVVYLMARPSDQIAKTDTTTGQQSGTTGQTVTTASLGIDKQVSDTIAGLRTTLGGINDAASAHAAVPKLQEAAAQLDTINGLSARLSDDQKKVVASMVNPTMPALNQMFDRVLAIPGASEELKPSVDALKAKLAQLAA